MVLIVVQLRFKENIPGYIPRQFGFAVTREEDENIHQYVKTNPFS